MIFCVQPGVAMETWLNAHQRETRIITVINISLASELKR